MTALAPWPAATEIAVVIPRSLNEPVGFSPSNFNHTSASTSVERCSAGMSGVPPSSRVTTGIPCSDGRRSAYSRITPRHWYATSGPLDPHHRVDGTDDGQSGECLDGRRECGVGCSMRDDDEVRPTVAAVLVGGGHDLLADGLDR